MRSDRSANRSVTERIRTDPRNVSWAMELSRGYRGRFRMRRPDVIRFKASISGPFQAGRAALDQAEQKETAGRRRPEQDRGLTPREIRRRLNQVLDRFVANILREVVDTSGGFAREAGKLRRVGVEVARGGASRSRQMTEHVRPAGNALLHRVLGPLARRGGERTRRFLRLADRLLRRIGNRAHGVRGAAANRFAR